MFVWNSANLTSQVSQDALKGVYVPPSANPTGASGSWVRQFDGPLWGEWFGLATGNAGIDNDTAFACMFTVGGTAGIREFRCGPGRFKKGSRTNLPENGRLRCAGNSTEAGSVGATVFLKDFAGGSLWGIAAGAILSDCDLDNNGNTGRPYVYIGGRNYVWHVLSKGFTARAKVSDSAADNCNGWRNIGCYFIDMPNGGFEVSQFRVSSSYANGLTLMAGDEYYNPADGKNYTVTVAGNGHITSSGTLAADRIANPTWWQLSSWPYGAPDVNDGKILDADFYNCGFGSLYIDNAYDNEIDVRIQDIAGIGLVVEHGSRGNHGYAYVEKMPGYTDPITTDDVYFGVTTAGNNLRLGQTNKNTKVTDHGSGNDFDFWFDDGSGHSGNAKNRLAIVNPNGNAVLEMHSGSNVVLAGRIKATNPTGSAGNLVLQAKRNGVDDLLDIATAKDDRFTLAAPLELWPFDVGSAPNPDTLNSGTLGYCSNGNHGLPCLAMVVGNIWTVASTGNPLSST